MVSLYHYDDILSGSVYFYTVIVVMYEANINDNKNINETTNLDSVVVFFFFIVSAFCCMKSHHF